MAVYQVKMQHSKESFTALSHMQYDLFCKSNRIARTVIFVVCVILGVTYYRAWWGILLIAYGCYLQTSTYSSANHTANKLAARITNEGLPFPASEYIFEDEAMRIINLSDHEEGKALPYADILRFAENNTYFFLFINNVGGYMIPKEELADSVDAFRSFLETKTGQICISPRSRFRRTVSLFKTNESFDRH